MRGAGRRGANARRGSSDGRAFSPLNQAGLLSWWAPELATRDGSNNVLTLPSYGGATSETLVPVAAAPVYSATGGNGRPILTYAAASSQALQKSLSATAAALSNAAAHSLYAVLRLNTGAGYRVACSFSTAAGALRECVNSPGSSVNDAYIHGGQNANGSKSLGSLCVYSATYDGATFKSYVNGVASISDANALSNGSLTLMQLGSDFFSAAASLYWDGAIGDVIVRSGADADAARQRNESFLKVKYGL